MFSEASLPSKCCCCIPLQTGSIILSILWILGFIGIIYQSLSFPGGVMQVSWSNIILGIILLIAAGCLLFGSVSQHPTPLLIYLVLGAIMLVTGVVLGVYQFVQASAIAPEYFATLFITTLINVYFWICNYSFYMQLNSGSTPGIKCTFIIFA